LILLLLKNFPVNMVDSLPILTNPVKTLVKSFQSSMFYGTADFAEIVILVKAVAVGDLLVSAFHARFVSALHDRLLFGAESMWAWISGARARGRFVSPMVIVRMPFSDHDILYCD
jgi:hypothetical protein